MNSENMIKLVDQQRISRGFLSYQDLLNIMERGNVILDPFSTQISSSVEIGTGNIFYPCVTVECINDGVLSINNNNIFYSNTFILSDKGKILIGSKNQFGDGNVSVKANYPNSEIIFGDGGRYINGIQIIGRSKLGSGSQIIGGLLTVQDCVLEAGEDYNYCDPDFRAGVLKGFGIARGLTIDKGKVINGQGTFSHLDIKDQSFFHIKKS